MKLLLDQNLSRFLVRRLAEAFPGSRHVVELGLERADDEVGWERAAHDGYNLVSKDLDFYQRSILLGFPPKVVWLGLGNCATEEVLESLLRAAGDLAQFATDPEQSLFVLQVRDNSRH